MFFAFAQLLDSPNEKKLRRENEELREQLTIIDKQIESLNQNLYALIEKDNEVYRTIYEVDPVSESLRNAGTGGTDKYEQLRTLSNSDFLINIRKRLDQMRNQFEVQEQSFSQLLKLAKDKKKMLAHIPAIQPIANKKLEHIGSGFGYRIDPFYRTRKFHAGMDFTAPRGTEIYAAADGIVETVQSDLWGYGQHVIISHGYGFKTLYAHMSKFKVKRGQKVTRGQLIGFVGSTGKSTAPHLHYEVWKNGTPVDPAYFYFNDLTDEEYNKMLELASSPNQSFD